MKTLLLQSFVLIIIATNCIYAEQPSEDIGLKQLKHLYELHQANLSKIQSYSAVCAETRLIDSRTDKGKKIKVTAQTLHREVWVPAQNIGVIHRERKMKVQNEGEAERNTEIVQKLLVTEEYALFTEKHDGIGQAFYSPEKGVLAPKAEQKMAPLVALSPIMNGFGDGDICFSQLVEQASAHPEIVLSVTPRQVGLYDIEFGDKAQSLREKVTIDTNKGALITEVLVLDGVTKVKELKVTPVLDANLNIWFPHTWKLIQFSPGEANPSIVGEASIEALKFNDDAELGSISLVSLEVEEGRVIQFQYPGSDQKTSMVHSMGELVPMDEYMATHPDGPIYMGVVNQETEENK